MSDTPNPSFFGRSNQNRRIGLGAQWIRWLVCTVLLATLLPALADEDEDLYFAVLGIIQKADALDAAGLTGKALTKYQEAQASLQTFRKTHPDWNPKVVAYRTKYLTDKVSLCSQKVAAAEQKPAENKPDRTGDKQPAAAESGVKVKLLDPGGEPRQVLRLHPKAGDKQTLNMTLKMTMGMKLGEMENPPMKLPAMVMTMDVTVKEVSPEGDISSELVMTDASISDEPGVMPQVAETMKSSLGHLKGLSGKGLTSNRGVNKGTEINMPAGADPQIRQAMDQMKDSFANLSSPLPEEAIGPGAKWEATMSLKSQGMSIDQTTTYELVSLKEDSLNTKVSIHQTAPKQKVQSPAMPDMKLDLLQMSGDGTGEISSNLGQLLPFSGTITSHTDLQMGVGAGAQQQKMGMKMDIDLHLEGK
jgi:hypothetical protein